MKVSFLVDNALREVLVNTYIGELVKACNIDYTQENYNFFYSPKGYDFIRRTLDHKDLMLLPSYNVGRTPEQLSRAIRCDSNIIATHAEQLFEPAFYEEKLNTKYKKSYNRHVMAHFVWGKFYSELLQKHANIPSDKIFITGNPKLEIARKLLKNKSAESNDSILIISDFDLGDLNDDQWNKFKTRYKASFKEPIHTYYHKARLETIDWVSDAAKTFPDKNFKLRIHPGENREAYAKLAGFKNVTIVGERDFIEDVLEAGLIFSFSSTSIFEVLVLGIQVFNMNVLELPQERRVSYFELFNWVDKPSFIDTIKKFSKGKRFYPSKERMTLLNKYMYDGNRNALIRNAIAIVECLKVHNQNYNWHDHLTNYKNLALSIAKDSIVKSGVFLDEKLHIDNFISSFAKKRHKQDNESDVRLKQDKIKSSLLVVNDLLTEREKTIIKNAEYAIRKEEDGVYIDL